MEAVPRRDKNSPAEKQDSICPHLEAVCDSKGERWQQQEVPRMQERVEGSCKAEDTPS